MISTPWLTYKITNCSRKLSSSLRYIRKIIKPSSVFYSQFRILHLFDSFERNLSAEKTPLVCHNVHFSCINPICGEIMDEAECKLIKDGVGYATDCVVLPEKDNILDSRNNHMESHARYYSSKKEELPPPDTSKPDEKRAKKPSVESWGGPEAESLILQITDNYLETVANYESLLIFFYTTWCSHCKLLKEPFGKAALKMKQEAIPGKLGAIDVTKKMNVADMFNLVAVPSLRYFRKGEFITTYNGKRSVDGIVAFMANPPVEPIIVKKADI